MQLPRLVLAAAASCASTGRAVSADCLSSLQRQSGMNVQHASDSVRGGVRGGVR